MYGFDGLKSNFSQQPESFSEQHIYFIRNQGSLNLTMRVSLREPRLSFPIIIQAAFWLVSFAFVFYLSSLNFRGHDALSRALLIFSCHIFNFYACYSFLVPRYYERGKLMQAFAGLLVLLLVLTPLRFYIEKQFVLLPHAWNTRLITRRGLLGFVLFSEISIAVIASLLRLAVSNEQNKSKMAELENLQLETELRFLKAQMSPHFLFNTINNIYSLTLIKSDKAPEALMKLSGLLRYLLYESHGKVLLVKEIEALKDYIELYQLRFENKIDVDIINEVGGKPIRVESLLLIPLLENALKHSGMGISAGAKARMKISMGTNDRMQVITGNTRGKPGGDPEMGGIGLSNIRKRLHLVYPGNHDLVINDSENYFSVTLNIPVV